ncbi:hypothetical protein N8772_00275 [Rickettsiales bacterium]|nr:hypothetical protein [Rickettsiales bacterium]
MIHQTSIISSKAKIAQDVEIGPFTTIYDNVCIGSGTIIDGYCEIGVKNNLSNNQCLNIGKNSHIRSHSIFYEGSTFGDGLITGHRVTVREETTSGKNFQIGTLSDIQGHCTIGNYVRTHSNVHIGQGSVIGNFVWIFPYVVLTNDPHPPSNVLQGVVIDDFSVIATMTTILPNVKIAKNCLIGANSLLTINTEEGMLYSGNPAKKLCPTNKIRLKDGSKKPAYPWNRHFYRGYPEEVINEWKKKYV